MRTPRATNPSWTAGPKGISLGQIVISFQRYARPCGDVIAAAPSSLGALPVARSKSDFLLPLALDEAFWIGVIPAAAFAHGDLALRASRLGKAPSLLSMHPAAQAAIVPGFVREDGRFDVFCRFTFGGMLATTGGQNVWVSIVDPKSFAAHAGFAPEPLDLRAGYGGWRLP